MKRMRYSTDDQRLDVQHKAIKAMQGGKNYLAPIDEALKHVDGEERRVLDVGTGQSSSFTCSEVRES